MAALRILVVEDHSDTVQAMARLLKGRGYDVTVATGYRSALSAAKGARFDLLLSDIDLPDGDGCDLLRDLRVLYPIEGIAISGYGMQHDVERCIKAGYSLHLLKPVAIRQIEEAIEEVMSRRHRNDSEHSQESTNDPGGSRPRPH